MTIDVETRETIGHEFPMALSVQPTGATVYLWRGIVKMKNLLCLLTVAVVFASSAFGDDTPTKSAATKEAHVKEPAAKAAKEKKKVAGRAGTDGRVATADDKLDLFDHDPRFNFLRKNFHANTKSGMSVDDQKKAAVTTLLSEYESYFSDRSGILSGKNKTAKRAYRRAKLDKFDSSLWRIVTGKVHPAAGYLVDKDKVKAIDEIQDKIYDRHDQLIKDLTLARNWAYGKVGSLNSLGGDDQAVKERGQNFAFKLRDAIRAKTITLTQASYALQRYLNADASLEMYKEMGYTTLAHSANYARLNIVGGKVDNAVPMKIDDVETALLSELKIETK